MCSRSIGFVGQSVEVFSWNNFETLLQIVFFKGLIIDIFFLWISLIYAIELCYCSAIESGKSSSSPVIFWGSSNVKLSGNKLKFNVKSLASFCVASMFLFLSHDLNGVPCFDWIQSALGQFSLNLLPSKKDLRNLNIWERRALCYPNNNPKKNLVWVHHTRHSGLEFWVKTRKQLFF